METNKIYNMDAYEGMQQLPDNSIDLVITDPPYQFSCKNPTGGGFMHKENKRHLINIKNSFWVEFDPFMGSGTTAVAAKQLKRKYLGFEINPEYVKIIKQRLAQQVL